MNLERGGGFKSRPDNMDCAGKLIISVCGQGLKAGLYGGEGVTCFVSVVVDNFEIENVPLNFSL